MGGPRWENQIKQRHETGSAHGVIVSKPLPRSAAAPGGARCPGAVDAIPAGTSGYCNPPCKAVTSCASAAAGPGVC